jgi:glycosyltransferase involved in cell wall biosynthesis
MTKLAIVTRNAIHGGVETMIALHQRYFEATVFVAGGHNRPDTCPFPFTYVLGKDPAQATGVLASALAPFDAVIYHWLPDWAVAAVKTSGKPCLEVVHRDDTADGDKTIPHVLLTHSDFLGDYLRSRFGRDVTVIPHGLEIERFPERPTGPYIGGLTSYYLTKGIDLFLEAWARIHKDFPSIPVRFYGAGDDLGSFQQIASRLGVEVEFLPAVTAPEKHISEFRLFVAPSRIEGMPFAVMESLAANVPVLCSDLPGMVEFNAAARRAGYPEPLLLFRSEDVDDLAEKMAAALRSGPPPGGRDYIRSRYGAVEHCREYAIAIGRAIGRPGNALPAPVPATTAAEPEERPPAASPVFNQLEIDQLKWVAYNAFRLRNNRLFPLIKRMFKFLAP